MEGHVPAAQVVRTDVKAVVVDVRRVVKVHVERGARIIVWAVVVVARGHAVLQIPMKRRIVKERITIINNYER